MNSEGNKVNLEGIMYNEDGTFKPLTASHGNVDGELAHLRNTYMEAEREYFEHLLAIESIRNEFIGYIDYDSYILLETAVQIQDRLESGRLETLEDLEKMKSMSPEERDYYHMHKLESAEGMMCLLLAAARDKTKILELIKTYESRISK